MAMADGVFSSTWRIREPGGGTETCCLGQPGSGGEGRSKAPLIGAVYSAPSRVAPRVDKKRPF